MTYGLDSKGYFPLVQHYVTRYHLWWQHGNEARHCLEFVTQIE